MKKYFCMMALTLVMGAAAAQEPETQQPQQPQQPPTVEQMAKMKADRMKQQLLLGDDQYDKVYKLCLKQSEAQQKRMEQMKKEQEEMSQQMKGILNEAQYERYEQLQSARMHRRMPNNGKGRFGMGRPAGMNNGGMAPAPMFEKGPAIDVRNDPRRNMTIKRDAEATDAEAEK